MIKFDFSNLLIDIKVIFFKLSITFFIFYLTFRLKRNCIQLILSTTAQVHIVLVPVPWPNSAQCDNVVRVGACSLSGLTFIERLCHCAPVFSLNSTDITSYAETSYETKRPTDKTSHGQPYVIQTKHPRNKTPYRTNIPQTNRPKGKNILLTKRRMGQTVLIFLGP